MSLASWNHISLEFPDGQRVVYTQDEYGNAAQHHQRSRAVQSRAYPRSGFDELTSRYYPGDGGPFEDAAGGRERANSKMVAKVWPLQSSARKIAFGDAAFNGVTTFFENARDSSKSFSVGRCKCGRVVMWGRNGTAVGERLPVPRHLMADTWRTWEECSRSCQCF